MVDTSPLERLIRANPDAFRARRGERTIFAGGRRVRTRTARDEAINVGKERVKVSTDDSGCATQIEEANHLHAVARPKPIRMKLRSPDD